MRIPYYDLSRITQSFEPELSTAIHHVIQSGWFLGGESVKCFEKDFSDFLGVRHCIGTGNGLDALTLILLAMKKQEGWRDDEQIEVIIPAFTFIASALAVTRAGMYPVFCDVGDDFLMDPVQAEALITPRTKVLLPVHLYGKTCEMRSLKKLAQQYNLKIVEDAAQAHGAFYMGHHAGNLGNAAAFSFYPGKNLGALGDGGAVVTNDGELAKIVRTLSNYGAREKYTHEIPGFNSRLDEIHAEVLSLKLKRLEEDNNRRRQIAKRYGEEIRNPHIRLPYNGNVQDSVFHIYPVLSANRDKLQKHLADVGIGTLIHYPIAIHKQKVYSEHGQETFRNAERFAAEELSLPISPLLRDDEIQYIIDNLNDYKP